jgi:hypothetical protein
MPGGGYKEKPGDGLMELLRCQAAYLQQSSTPNVLSRLLAGKDRDEVPHLLVHLGRSGNSIGDFLA